MKTCYACGQEKPDEDFYAKGDKRRRPDALSAYCKTCHKAKVKARPNPASAWHATEKGRAATRRAALKRNFNLTPEQYDEMLAEQGGVCAICGGVNENGRKLAVDHDHATGKVRQLLCAGCNSGLGHFRDDPEIMFAAIRYLNLHTKIAS